MSKRNAQQKWHNEMLYEEQIFPVPAKLITEQEQTGIDDHETEM